MTDRGLKRGGWIVTVYAALLILIGLALAVGGVALIRYGGTFYYFIAGFATTLSGALLLRGDGRGRWVYGALLVGTLAWALAEVGLDGWALVPRLVAPFVLGLGMLLPPIRRLVPAQPLPMVKPSMGGWRAMGAGLAAALLLGFSSFSLIIDVAASRGVPDPLASQRYTPDRPQCCCRLN